MKQKKRKRINNRRLKAITLVEMAITIVLIATITYIATKLIIEYNEQFKWGREASNVSFGVINALDIIENELVQASASSVVLSNQHQEGSGYQTIDFSQVTGFDIATKTPLIDISNSIRFTVENGTLNKYIINKTTIPPTVVNGPIALLENVTTFLVSAVSQQVYNISISVQKRYSDGQLLTRSSNSFSVNGVTYNLLKAHSTVPKITNTIKTTPIKK